MRARIGLLVAALLLFVAFVAFSPTLRTPAGRAALGDLLRRLRETGSFSHPDCPWAVRARRVRGNTLYFVEFLRRSADGGFDVAGKAVQLTLQYSDVFYPFSPFEPAKPEHRPAIMARAFRGEITWDEGDAASFNEQVVFFHLPERLDVDRFRRFGESLPALTGPFREALARPYDQTPAQAALIKAFGEDADEFLCQEHAWSKGRTVVVSMGKPEPLKDSRCRLRRCAVVQIRPDGSVGSRFLGGDVTASIEDICALANDDGPVPLRLTDARGRVITLPVAE
jgi:hypothetical protein